LLAASAARRACSSLALASSSIASAAERARSNAQTIANTMMWSEVRQTSQNWSLSARLTASSNTCPDTCSACRPVSMASTTPSHTTAAIRPAVSSRASGIASRQKATGERTPPVAYVARPWNAEKYPVTRHTAGVSRAKKRSSTSAAPMTSTAPKFSAGNHSPNAPPMLPKPEH